MREQGRGNWWLAEQVGVSKQMVSLWRAGNRRLTDERRKQIADVLGIRPDELGDNRGGP
jgi:transcriptional regulator with XRE-family HTH domain